MTDIQHVPVLVDEILTLFHPQAGDRLLDATLGQGGHARAYLQATAPTGSVVGLDADSTALATAEVRLAPFGERLRTVHANFAYLNDAVTGGGIVQATKSTEPREALAKWGNLQHSTFQHILFDLGIGSHQLADKERGFSFTSHESLSMRYGSAVTLPPAQVAALNHLERRLGQLPDVPDILSQATGDELAEIIYTYGEERFRGRIAEALKEPPVPATSAELAERVSRAVPGRYRHARLHPATRTFQALRLAVNRELESLAAALPQAYELLVPGGVVAVISWHSLEDRIVKRAFRQYHDRSGATLLTRKPIRAGNRETESNPRARSAKLRALRKKTDR